MSGPFASPELWFGLFGGLAMFLFGMDVMTTALKRAAGTYLRVLLAKLTRNRFVAAGIGAFVTSIIQSSSVTTVLLVGFISAGLLSMSQSVAVIMGANIGTTITAQILAFKVTKLALPIIAVGFLVSLVAKRENWRQYGVMVLGLGLVFYGMVIMSDAVKPLRSYEPFVQFMTTMANPLLAAFTGLAFTAIVQSSSATTGILIVLAGQGLVSLEAAIAMSLGANVGTCITAALASIGKPREAVRAAMVHTLFNVVGVVLWIAFVPQLAELARLMSPTHAELEGAARLAAEAPRQIANIHTFFNIANTLLLIGFTTQIARLVEWMIPDRPVPKERELEPKHLDDNLLSTPSIALSAVRREVVRMGEWVRDQLGDVVPAGFSRDEKALAAVAERDKAVDSLHREIVSYLGQISNGDLSEVESQELMELLQIANDFEFIADRISTDMVTSFGKSIKEGVVVSDVTARVIGNFHKTIMSAFDNTLVAVGEQDGEIAAKVRSKKHQVVKLKQQLSKHGVDRLTADAPRRLATYTREIELVELLNNIYRTLRRIAGSVKKANSNKQDTAS